MIGTRLQQHTDERAGLIVIELEPVVKHIEMASTALRGLPSEIKLWSTMLTVQPASRRSEDGEHERPWSQVTVERGFGDTGWRTISSIVTSRTDRWMNKAGSWLRQMCSWVCR
jgi:hypothetical protein